MAMRCLLVLAALSLAVRVSAEQGANTYRAVVAGMSCKQSSAGHLECDYRVGRSLHFTIAGVGDGDAGIAFMESSFGGDFYASVGLLHGCVIVWPGKASKNPNPLDVAFVSPRDGKVYQDWVTCGDVKPK